MHYDMKKARQLSRLMGHESCTHEIRKCSGKWAGTYDHYLRFEDGSIIFVCNGSHNFNRKITDFIRTYENLSKRNHDLMLDILKEQAQQDSEKARTENLAPYICNSIKLVHDGKDITAAVNITVDGCTYDFVETSLQYAIKAGPEKLKELLRLRNEREMFTAGGIEHPTFVMLNVRHSHKEDLYRLKSNGSN